MRCKSLLLLAIILVCTHTVLAKEPKLDLSTRYLLLRLSDSAFGKELKQAGDAGYQILFASADGAALLLEKGAPAPQPRDYLLVRVRCCGEKKEQKEVNEAVAKGYRLIPRTLLSQQIYGGDTYDYAVMERAEKPESVSPTELLTLGGHAHLQEEMCKASGNAFRFADIIAYEVVMEKPAGKQPESGTAATGLSEAQGTCPYWVVEGKREETVEKELNEAAARGYEVRAASSILEVGLIAASVFPTVVIMEKAPPGAPRKEYLFLTAVRPGKLEENIQQAAVQGYRAIGRTLSWRGLTKSVVMEKGGEPGSFYEYSMLIGTSPSRRFELVPPRSSEKLTRLQKEITHAAEQGYSPVGIVSPLAPQGLVLLERPR
jgi:hypothetical protein